MYIKSIIASVEKDELLALVLENKIFGYRLCSYNIAENKYYYYDFQKKSITDKSQLEFIEKIESKLRRVPLLRNNGLLITQEELSGKVQVAEVKDISEIVKALAKVIKEYKGKEKIKEIRQNGVSFKILTYPDDAVISNAVGTVLSRVSFDFSHWYQLLGTANEETVKKALAGDRAEGVFLDKELGKFVDLIIPAMVNDLQIALKIKGKSDNYKTGDTLFKYLERYKIEKITVPCRDEYLGNKIKPMLLQQIEKKTIEGVK